MDTATEQQSDPKTILVVDDELSVLGVVKCMLECDDYDVLLANSAAAALRIASNNDLPIDLLITDVIMPDVKGPDLAEQILALRPEVKLLFMSGYTDSDVVRVRVLDPNLSFLPKPFTSDGLLETVKRALSAPASCALAAGFNMLSQAS
jgi:two-component system, cell cycle sensor histidine kinase and response regulator CckA